MNPKKAEVDPRIIADEYEEEPGRSEESRG